MKLMKRFLTLLVCLSLCLGLASAAWASAEPAADPAEAAVTEEAFSAEGPIEDPAEEPAAPVENEPAAPRPDFDGFPDGDALYEAYIAQAFGLESGPALDGVPADVGAKLTGAAAALYPILLDLVKDVAAGRRASTEFRIPASEVLPAAGWTAADLGIAELTRYGALTEQAQAAAEERVSFYFWDVVTKLMVDCPCEMYWFDKTSEENDLTFPTVYPDGGRVLAEGEYVFRLPVSPEYQAGGLYEVDTSCGRAAETAAANAAAIVAENRGRSDRDKLDAYLCRLCELNSYNYAAVEDDSTPYGGPWQLLWMFDGDPDTNVVCEGYAKSFQYLCDLTAFDSPEICCRSVWGDYSYGGDEPGGHMWNVVRMDDGRNYLVDVTNCDLDEDGVDYGLFLKGCVFGSVYQGYFIDSGYEYYDVYVYDYDIWEAYTGDQIVLASSDYGQEGFIVPDEGIAIDAALFPSDTLRAYIAYWFDWEEDGYLSPLERADVTMIDLESEKSFADTLRGIEYFPNLRSLYFQGDNITELDVSRNTRLASLDCSRNDLNALDLSHNPELEWVDCSGNRLKELTLGEHPRLYSFYCEGNRLQSVDIGGCPQLLEHLAADERWQDADGYIVYGGDQGGDDEYWDMTFDVGVELLTTQTFDAQDVNRDGAVNAADAAAALAEDPAEAAAILRRTVAM